MRREKQLIMYHLAFIITVCGTGKGKLLHKRKLREYENHWCVNACRRSQDKYRYNHSCMPNVQDYHLSIHPKAIYPCILLFFFYVESPRRCIAGWVLEKNEQLETIDEMLHIERHRGSTHSSQLIRQRFVSATKSGYIHETQTRTSNNHTNETGRWRSSGPLCSYVDKGMR